MIAAQLTVGARQIERRIGNADDLLRQYRLDTGCDYLEYQSTTPEDKLLPEDLAVTLLLNSRAGWQAFRSLRDFGPAISLARLPHKPLEHTNKEERRQVASLIAELAQWPGFAASVATKVLHKKRPDLIPILDNQAIFGAYMNPAWPAKPARVDSIKSLPWISRALDWIAFDVTRPENAAAWEILQKIEPSRTLIELFDSVWWMYFRLTQPVKTTT